MRKGIASHYSIIAHDLKSAVATHRQSRFLFKAFRLVLWISIVFAILRSEAAEQELVRVRLQKSAQDFSVQATGLRVQTQSSWQLVSIPRSHDFRVTRQGLLWKLERPSPQSTQFFTGPVLVLQAQKIEKSGRVWPNQIVLTPKGENKFDVIGALPIESYLVGVVSGEMPWGWPLEALKAQAVAARSYTLAVMRERRKQPFHVESTVMDQVFKALTDMEWKSARLENVIRAVQDTAGEYIRDHKGHALKTYYHSHCGGQTANTKSVWGYGSEMTAVADPSCVHSKIGAWTMSFSLSDLQEKIVAKYPAWKNDTLSSVVPERTQPLRRANRIELKWQSGRSLWLSGNSFRAAVGFDKVQSTNFEVRSTEENIVFSGFGRGHGVGMCQFGTKALAEQKKSYQEIIAHYFPSRILASLGLPQHEQRKTESQKL